MSYQYSWLLATIKRNICKNVFAKGKYFVAFCCYVLDCFFVKENFVWTEFASGECCYKKLLPIFYIVYIWTKNRCAVMKNRAYLWSLRLSGPTRNCTGTQLKGLFPLTQNSWHALVWGHNILPWLLICLPVCPLVRTFWPFPRATFSYSTVMIVYWHMWTENYILLDGKKLITV